jgi:hypothetical protein
VQRIASIFSIYCALMCFSCAQRPKLPDDVTWDDKAGVFRWRLGEVKLPIGFVYQWDPGSDTFRGHFTSPNGRLIIQHDIGGYAGAYANRRSAYSFDERIVEGVRVWTTRRKYPDGKGGQTTLVAVTFPDNGCANFYLQSSNIEDAAPIAVIARSFRPKGLGNPGPLCDRSR